MSGVVYVVDSDAAEAARVAAQVQALDHETAIFGSADACLQALAAREPFALLISLNLAGGGDECCRRIKENFAWRHLPVILITQTDQAHELMYCWRAAALDFLRRPIAAERLKPKLDAIARQGKGEGGDRSFVGRSVLLLEASRFYRHALAGNLEHAGLHVLTAEEPEEAIDAAQGHGSALDAALIGLPSVAHGLDVARTLAELPKRPRTLLVLSPNDRVDPAIDAKVEQLTASRALNKRDLPFDLVLSRILSHLKQTHALELRASERVPFFSVVDFSTDGKGWGQGFSYDVSSGGIFVRTLTPPQAGSAVTLRMQFVAQTALSTGVVAWSNPFVPRGTFASPIGMGVRLIETAAPLQSQIQGLRRQLPPRSERPTP